MSLEETTLVREAKTIKAQLTEALSFILRFLREPWTRINNLPNWSWTQNVLVAVVFTGVTGTIGGVFESALAVLGGFFVVPLTSLVTISISTLLLFYFIRFFTERQISFKRLWQLVFFANVPLFVFQIIAPLFPLISLIGLAATAYLLYLALTETYKIDALLAKKVLGGLYAVFAVVWLWGHLDSVRLEKTFQSHSAAPEVHLGK